MIQALFDYQFMQNALIASILASIVCGVIGVIVVEKKLVMMSGGIAHTAYGGVGLGYLLGFEPIIGAFLFSVSAALGIVFIALMPGYPPDISSYLFGNILLVTKAYIYLMIILSFLVVFIVIALFHDWKAYLFDEEFASIIGIKTAFLEYLLLILVAMTVVVLIRVAGIILALALLTAPSAMASLFLKKLMSRMIFAVIFGMLFCISGLRISYTLNIASGACIVILSVVCYFLTYIISIVRINIKRIAIK
ncbi:MAG: metal ABC transporter permease [Velocimicrobium sp.]